MNELLMLGAAVGAIWLIIIVLRVPAFAVFFSLLVGQLLSSEISTESFDFVSGVINVSELRYVQLSLLLLPFFLTILFLRGRSPKSKLVIEIIPSFFVALTATLLAYPLLPGLETIVNEAAQGRIDQYRTVILIAASVSGLLSAWVSFPKSSKRHKHSN